MPFDNLFVIIVLSVAMIILGTQAYAGFKAAPWLPAWSRDLDRITDMINLQDGQKMIDLGAGDAKVLIAVAQKMAHESDAMRYLNEKSIIGLDLSLLPYLIGKYKILSSGLGKKIDFRYGDFLKYPLNQIDVVYCFLTPRAMFKIKPKLEKELKIGARIVSYGFEMPGWQPELINRPKSTDLPILVYRR